MVSLKEISWSLYGAYRLARNDPGALQYFNLSTAGFFTSFAAIILALPFYAIENAIEYQLIATETPIIRFLILLSFTFFINWIVFLLVMAVFAKILDFSDKFSIFVIVHNWAQLAIIVVWMPLSVLSSGLAGGSFYPILSLLFLGAIYVYLWHILRVTLQISGIAALGFAFLKFIISIFANESISDLLFTGPV